MKKTNRHDEYLEKLYTKLDSWGFEHVNKKVPYFYRSGDTKGEIDIYAKLGDAQFNFEVKCSKKGIRTATKQLRRWKSSWPGERKHGYVYVGEDDWLEMIF
jgi:predicted RecB family endonuclease